MGCSGGDSTKNGVAQDWKAYGHGDVDAGEQGVVDDTDALDKRAARRTQTQRTAHSNVPRKKPV